MDDANISRNLTMPPTPGITFHELASPRVKKPISVTKDYMRGVCDTLRLMGKITAETSIVINFEDAKIIIDCSDFYNPKQVKE